MTESPREKVAICIPYYRTVEGPTLLSAMEMCLYSGRYIDALPLAVSSAYVEQNRNGLVKLAFQMGIEFDYLLWMDTDMIFPADALLRLMSHEKDIVGVNYRQRTPPYTYVGHYLAENGEASLDMANILKPGLQPMFQMPTGLLLTRFDIYRKMKWPWFDASVTGPRDDIYFCRKARSMGYEIWCDQELTAKVRHRDMQEIPWFNPEQLQIHRGAGLMKDTGEAESAAVAKKMKPHFEKLNDQSAA